MRKLRRSEKKRNISVKRKRKRDKRRNKNVLRKMNVSVIR